MRRRSELVSSMKTHSMTELNTDELCRISRNDSGKEFCFIFYPEATIGLLYVLGCHAQKYIGLNGFF